ncbi:discoidin domain-containing protein [Arcanobacterium hippocoleae]
MRWETFQDGIDDSEILREAVKTKGADKAAVDRLIASVGDTDADTPQAWAQMVSARSMALDLIGEQEDTKPVMKANTSTPTVTPGAPAKITVTVNAPINKNLDPVEVTPKVPKGWQITPASARTGKIHAGQTGRIEFWAANNYGSGDGTITFSAEAAGEALTADVAVQAAAGKCVSAKAGDYAANSEEPTQGLPKEGPVSLAFDNDPSTHWHSEWNGHNYPIETSWKTDAGDQPLCAVTYQQRQSGTNGNASAAKIYTSADGKTWTEAASVTPQNTRDVQSFQLPQGTKGPWVKFSITAADSTVSGKNFGSAAEFGATKLAAANTAISVADTIGENNVPLQTYEIPDNGISYIVNGTPQTAGRHTARPGEKISVTMNGLAQHGLTLPENSTADWEHTFLKPSVIKNGANVKPGDSLPDGMKITLTGNNAGSVSYELGENAPEWLHLSDDGILTGKIPEDTPAGKMNVPFIVAETVADNVKRPAIAGTFKTAGILTINVLSPENPALPVLEPVVSSNPIAAEVGKLTSSSAPTFKNEADGTAAAKPKGTVFELSQNVPKEASINSDTGVVSFTASEAQYGQEIAVTVTVRYPAEYAASDPNDDFTVTFKVAPRPVHPDASIADIADVTATVGAAITPITLSVDNGSISDVSGLPQGLSFDGDTISGTPKETGTFTVTVVAVNKDHKMTSKQFIITVTAQQSGGTAAPGGDTPDDDTTGGSAQAEDTETQEQGNTLQPKQPIDNQQSADNVPDSQKVTNTNLANLPATGADIAAAGLLALVLLGTGAAGIALRRRR